LVAAVALFSIGGGSQRAPTMGPLAVCGAPGARGANGGGPECRDFGAGGGASSGDQLLCHMASCNLSWGVRGSGSDGPDCMEATARPMSLAGWSRTPRLRWGWSGWSGIGPARKERL